MFFLKLSDVLQGVLILHIDDFMYCGANIFEDTVSKLTVRFTAGNLSEKNFRYVGFDIGQKSDCVIVDQSEFVNQLNIVHLDPDRLLNKNENLSEKETTEFRSQIGKCSWAVRGSRPDFCFEIMELSTKLKNPIISDMIKVNKIVSQLKENRSFILFPFLENLNSCKIISISDASHANMSDGCSSGGGHMILICDSKNNSCVLSWSCNKIKRVVKSTLAAETLSLSEALDHALNFRHIFNSILNICFPVICLVDNYSVVEAIHSTKLVEDKRLRIDLAIIKQAVHEENVLIKWIPGTLMYSDVLTKKGVNRYHILKLLQNGHLDIDI